MGRIENLIDDVTWVTPLRWKTYELLLLGYFTLKSVKLSVKQLLHRKLGACPGYPILFPSSSKVRADVC